MDVYVGIAIFTPLAYHTPPVDHYADVPPAKHRGFKRAAS
jgi:hypothetical protein